MSISRVYSEKKKGFDVEASSLFRDIKENLSILSLKELRILVRYDISSLDEKTLEKAKNTILSEPQVDNVSESVDLSGYKVFATELLPGQFDQRADSAAQCIQILTGGEKPVVRAAKVYAINPEVTCEEIEAIKKYIINPIESREASLEIPKTLDMELPEPKKVKTVEGFIELDEVSLKKFLDENGFAFDISDIKFCQNYFKNEEKRNPTVTELKMIDTYWSDHCRHTTFATELKNVEIEDEVVKAAFLEYIKTRDTVYAGRTPKDMCFMDIATLATKDLKKKGVLKNLDESEEINACSIEVDVDIDGKDEKWLVMFKNETHNHPTEIEPFGGAATCLGGAIRDPLSGRSYVYQAMRVTGSGDPRVPLKETLPGKLPQRKISKTAAAGYSSYGNQIGLATGLVREIYDESYKAKRLEIGAVIAAAPKSNVIREVPEPGDVVVLLGGKTGRDGCGGATGSSKAHTDKSLENCGAEVQKGNPPEERKLQRLFRKPEVTRLIRRCNDFGAGGVSVAIGELADGLLINLDNVPKKYAGLDGTELAISESQERMAVVVRDSDKEKMIEEAGKENIEATVVATVTKEKRLRLFWQGDKIVDISREFLNSNGGRRETDVLIKANKCDNIFESINLSSYKTYEEKFVALLSDLNVCMQKGLGEMFDSTIGANTVLMPFGGKYELTPTESMAAKIPLEKGETKTATVMSYGYDNKMASKSPFYSGVYAIIHSIARVVATGCDISKVYLTLQEYFKKLGNDKERWGEPMQALLGAFLAQERLNIAAIGGKDSMSGSFNDMDVVPTLVSFAVSPANTDEIVSPEFKKTNTKVLLIENKKDGFLPDFNDFTNISKKVYDLIKSKKAYSAYAVPMGGVGEAVLKMCFGNKIGFKFSMSDNLFNAGYGSYIVEVDNDTDIPGAKLIGYTLDTKEVEIENEKISLEKLIDAFVSPLESVYKTAKEIEEKEIDIPLYETKTVSSPKIKIAKPKVVVPVFPGTNCEYDTKKRFELAGADVDVIVFKNLKQTDVLDSAKELAGAIKNAQIVMIPGGFSGGDEPDGSGKFIATALRNELVKEALRDMLYNRDGLMLGICNGFQALIKLGLVPFGDVIDTDDTCPTLTYNTIGRHISTMADIKVMSNKSPWFSNVKVGDVYKVPLSHGEGRFIVSDKLMSELVKNGQIATCYVDAMGNPTYEKYANPNGSNFAVEGITSLDGRILGKMGHSERIGDNLYKNIHGKFDMKIFEAGVSYFK
ncbi:MAG: phosphoribosylformylglycinamidine synthase [Ruminococcaceae bacterium]|nr:phosphoribosylformylglycinamidine synthase [Oscillospiraceae bacterium]